MTKRFPSLPSFFTFPALPIFRVKAVKAALEVIILQIILFVPLSLFYLSTPKRAERTLLSASGVFYLIFGLFSVFWFGLRWRLRPELSRLHLGQRALHRDLPDLVVGSWPRGGACQHT